MHYNIVIKTNERFLPENDPQWEVITLYYFTVTWCMNSIHQKVRAKACIGFPIVEMSKNASTLCLWQKPYLIFSSTWEALSSWKFLFSTTKVALIWFHYRVHGCCKHNRCCTRLAKKHFNLEGGRHYIRPWLSLLQAKTHPFIGNKYLI